MNMVKNKELSIEGALDLAQKETHAEKEAMNLVFPMVRLLTFKIYFTIISDCLRV